MLEVLESSAERRAFVRVEIVEDDFGQLVAFVEVVEEVDEPLGLGFGPDAVKASIGASLAGEAGVDLTLWPEVELHDPAFFMVPLSNGFEGFILRCFRCGNLAEPMIRHLTSIRVKVVVAFL